MLAVGVGIYALQDDAADDQEAPPEGFAFLTMGGNFVTFEGNRVIVEEE